MKTLEALSSSNGAIMGQVMEGSFGVENPGAHSESSSAYQQSDSYPSLDISVSYCFRCNL